MSCVRSAGSSVKRIPVDGRYEAEQTLKSLESDANLIPANIAEWWSNYLFEHYNRYLDTLSLLNERDRRKHILEIGSLPGHFTILLKKIGYDNLVGTDIDPSRAKQLWDKYSVPVHKVDIEQESLPFPSNSFDIVLFTEILEHLRLNPLHALREVYRVLKSDGRIILSTPSITVTHRLLFLFGKTYQGNAVEEFRKLEWLGHMGHIRLYSSDEVKGFLEYTGFKELQVTSKHYRAKTLGRENLARTLMGWRFHNSLYVTAKKE